MPLLGVAYADGAYTAVGQGGVLLGSTDTITWTQVPFVTGNTLHGVAGNSGWRSNGLPQFMAVGDLGTAAICEGSNNWSTVSSGTTNSLYGVTWDSSFFIMVGDGGTVTELTSVGFTQRPQSLVRTTNNLYAVASGSNGIVAAVGDLNHWVDVGNDVYYTNGILFSLNSGFTWRSQMWEGLDGLPNVWFPSDTFILGAVAYGTNGFVAVGDTGYTLEFFYPGVVFTSSQGTNWVELPNITSENSLRGATYGNGLYVLVGDAGAIVVSSNLLNWTEATGYHRSAITAIACSDSLCVASALPMSHGYSSFPDFSTLISTNGADWSVSTTNLPAMASLATGNDQFVGVSKNTIYSTTDGEIWQSNSSFTNSFRGVSYANGQFIAVGENGSIFTSIDAANWNDSSVVSTGSFSGVAFGNGRYVAAGSITATSTDGNSWAVGVSNPPAAITRIVYGKGLFVAAAYTGSYYNPNGAILTSQDGLTWQSQFTTGNVDISGIVYNGGTFVAITALGTPYSSVDGTNWTFTGSSVPLVDGDSFSIYYRLDNLSLSYLGHYCALGAYKGTFLAGRLDGVLVQSGNTWSQPTMASSQMTVGGFAFSYNQQVDVPFHVQTSTNLLDWQNIYSGIGTGQPTNFVFSATSNSPSAFFRIVSP
jgi:hypothetical protein